jgi:hypothetical protein
MPFAQASTNQQGPNRTSKGCFELSTFMRANLFAAVRTGIDDALAQLALAIAEGQLQ